MIKEILSKDNLNNAIEDLLRKNDSCGSDGVFISEFAEYWKLNGDKIICQIQDGLYSPSVVQKSEIIMLNGKRRMISRFTCTDRVILKAMKDVLEPLWEGEFSTNSFAYQKGKGTGEAAQKAAQYIQDGYSWVLELDVESFFDNIVLGLLEDKIAKRINDKAVLSLIHTFLYCDIESDYRKEKITRGLIQGSSLSPLLSNVYMNEFDHYMESSYCYCRYSDNINVYFVEQKSALEAIDKIKQYLWESLELKLNKDKCGIYPALNRKYLGFEFYQKNGAQDVFVRKAKCEKASYYKRWHTSALQKIDRNYHLINDGILTKKDYTVLFENKSGKYYLPVETCQTINIYSNAVFSSGFFEFVNQKKLSVAMYDKCGE